MPAAAEMLHLDVTQTVDLQSPQAVLAAIDALLHGCYGADYGRPLLERAMSDLVAAFCGDYPGLLRCDTHYHDLRHAMDSGLAMARLIRGLCVSLPVEDSKYLDREHALLGVLLALYHDIGLLRRAEEAQMQGAQLTPVHEARGVVFMRDYLGRTVLSQLAHKSELIMVTRLLSHLPAQMCVRDRTLASLLGTADIYAQLADRAYLEKCRDFLFAEFTTFGLAGTPDSAYPTARVLLEKTPAFYTGLLRPRIDTEYDGAARYLSVNPDGRCPYAEAIARNLGEPNRNGFATTSAPNFLLLQLHQGEEPAITVFLE